jgi:non-specific serine/threonine protein kinase
VCSGEGIEAWEVLDLLSALVNKSLVQAEDIDGGLRYRLLETVRQYGQERLVAAGEEAGVQDAHLAYFVALTQQALLTYLRPEEVHWFARLEAEPDNLRAALRWSLRTDVAVEGLKLVVALGRFWYVHGHLQERRTWLGAALATGSTTVPQLRIWALHWAGLLACMQGDNEHARTTLEASVALCRVVGDKVWAGISLSQLGDMALYQGNLERARTLLEESLTLLEESLAHAPATSDISAVPGGDDTTAWQAASGAFSARMCAVYIAESRRKLGDVTLEAGDQEQAVALYEESLALSRTLGDSSIIGYALMRRGQVAKDQGDYARAAAAFTESLELGRLMDNRDVCR